LSWRTVLLANVAFWPAWTLAAGYAAARTPAAHFARDDVLTRRRPVERGGAWYVEQFAIQQWKDRLPEAGAMFGDFAKRDVTRDVGDLERFVTETRRAEHAHWGMAAGAFLTILWNPWWAFPINASVGSLANLPCIAVQRYNRARLVRLLERIHDA
jgi:glycosyl-4,4'-diaponeurosporenoate acyltransferase